MQRTDLCRGLAVLMATSIALAAGALVVAAEGGVGPSSSPTAESAAGVDDALPPIIGTWKMVGMPEGYVHLKVVTPTHFCWFTYHEKTGKTYSSASGRCYIDGNEYVEVIDSWQTDGIRPLFGHRQVFTWRVEGDTWYHTGQLSSGKDLRQTWQRVKLAKQRER